MWLLENAEAFQGRRLWLRPGKTYLFGRTAAESGQLVISHNTISRKHLTITVDGVETGHSHSLSSRSTVTIEDLATKIGTVANGNKIKGSKYIVESEDVEIMLGKCPNKFRLTWFPVVFTFSFTTKELQTQPLTVLQQRFEHLDIKLLTDYNLIGTTHVISRKRNTAKGLQALINGKYIVTETFLDAITNATLPPENGTEAEPCLLEQDFDKYWPDAMQHLPSRGGEPVQHPDDIYSPDTARNDVFDGYTFIFYDQTQYNNLLAPITNGGGKALLHTVKPEETDVDDFVGYVKNVAGEKGLGCFDDGSEGKGVVLVRYLPAKGAAVAWYTNFFTTVSLRLDHRPIEQNEFLEAILINDASILRRPLEVESSMPSQEAPHAERQQPQPQPDRGPQSSGDADEVATPALEPVEESQPAPRRGRTRRPVKKRFAGFDDEDDIDMDSIPLAPTQQPPPVNDDEGGLFVSQDPDASQRQNSADAGISSPRKRGASSFQEDDLMDGVAPAVARFKRQRLERGGDFASPSPEPEPVKAEPIKAPKKKKAKELDVLALAAQNREEQDARARAEKEDLANLPDDVDLAEIRRLNIVEEVEVRIPDRGPRTRDQDVADGRWDPKWNGVKNFKKFRRRGEATGRQPARIIISLTEAKNKEFGVGDNYWLEEEEASQRKRAASSYPTVQTTLDSLPSAPESAEQAMMPAALESSGEEDEDVVLDSVQSRTRNSRRAATRSQNNARSQASQSQGKRAAAEPAKSQPAKRQRQAPKLVEVADSDDSDDELQFRFGKRR